MSDKMNCYKVVQIEEGKYYSVIAMEPARVEYQLNQPVSGKEDTPLFAFSSLANAQRWASMYSYRVIFHAIGRGRVRKPKFIVDWVNLERKFISFWKDPSSLIKVFRGVIPIGTVFYKSIEIVEMVERNDIV